MTNLMSARARQLRRSRTDAERCLWRKLRELNRQGCHFRQQAPIGPYIADFLDHRAKLVIELDGGQHGERDGLARDARRTAWLHRSGCRVLRFWNGDVLRNSEGVMMAVLVAMGRLRDPTDPPASTAEIAR